MTFSSPDFYITEAPDLCFWIGLGQAGLLGHDLLQALSSVPLEKVAK